MEENKNKFDRRSFTPIIWFHEQVDVCVQHQETGELNWIIAYEVLSYIDMYCASVLYYLVDGSTFCEEYMWETYVEIEITYLGDDEEDEF